MADADWRGVYFGFINVYAPAEPRGPPDLFLALPDVCVTNKVRGELNVSFDCNGVVGVRKAQGGTGASFLIRRGC